MKQNISVFPVEAAFGATADTEPNCSFRKGKGKRQLKLLNFPVVLTRLNKVYALR